MAQRGSGYERLANELYQTPPWVTQALLNVIQDKIPQTANGQRIVWEPAAGEGKMSNEMVRKGLQVLSTDIQRGQDFLQHERMVHDRVGAIITNPPYNQAQAFVEHAHKLMRSRVSHPGLVAMLLKVDFDSARTRQHLFKNSIHWSDKIVLLDRITWVEPPPRKPGEKPHAGPSENHAWFIWRFGGNKVYDCAVHYAEMPEEERKRLSAVRSAVAA